MKFSIVTCTRNSAQWLPESIASVTAQRNVEIEKIFVDGDSTDETLNIIEQIPGQVKVLTGHTNGISEAMNAGANAASGDVIAHLHSDDYYTGPEVLSTVAKNMQNKPEARWLYGRCMNVIGGKAFENHFETAPFSYEGLIDVNIVPHPATFIKREFFDESGGFDTSLKYVMDYDLWLRLGSKNTPIQISDYLAAFRIHEDGLSTREIWRCHAECLTVRLAYANKDWRTQMEHRVRHTKVSLRIVRDNTLRKLGHDPQTQARSN